MSEPTVDQELRSAAARLLGCPAHEVVEVVKTDDGALVGMFDGQRYIIVPEDRPHRGEHGVMFYGVPAAGYRGSYPVFTPNAAHPPLQRTPARGTVITTGDPGTAAQVKHREISDRAESAERAQTSASTAAGSAPEAPPDPAVKDSTGDAPSATSTDESAVPLKPKADKPADA